MTGGGIEDVGARIVENLESGRTGRDFRAQILRIYSVRQGRRGRVEFSREIAIAEARSDIELSRQLEEKLEKCEVPTLTYGNGSTFVTTFTAHAEDVITNAAGSPIPRQAKPILPEVEVPT